MRVNSMRWRVGMLFVMLALVVTACNRLLSPPPPPTPTSSVHFILLEPVRDNHEADASSEEVRQRVYMTAELIGDLTLVDDCLRVNDAYAEVSYLVLWQPELSLKAEDDSLYILNEAGQVVAQVGEEVYLGGGEVKSIDHLNEYVRQQLPPACPGPYWIVGAKVRPNIRASSELTTVDLVSNAERAVFLVRKQPLLDQWATDETTLTGQLVLFDRCPEIIPHDQLVNYTPVWPPDYNVQFQAGEDVIVDGLGQVVAQVGEKVYLSGSAIPVDWDLEMYRQLHDNLPGECNGPYWVVDTATPLPTTMPTVRPSSTPTRERPPATSSAEDFELRTWSSASPDGPWPSALARQIGRSLPLLCT
jgi:hypothetical protein